MCVCRDTPKCTKTCEPSYTPSYKDNKQYSYCFYCVHSSAMITTDDPNDGPVEGAFLLYAHFLQFKPEVQCLTNKIRE